MPTCKQPRPAHRRLALVILLVAAFALFAHHASPGMGMDTAGDAAHSCVAVAAHTVTTTPALAAALFLGLSLGLGG